MPYGGLAGGSAQNFEVEIKLKKLTSPEKNSKKFIHYHLKSYYHKKFVNWCY